MSVNTRLTRLEQKLLPNKHENIEVIVCELDETAEQARDKRGIDRDDSKHRIFVVFD